MGERNSERRGLLICTAVLFSFCLFFFIFYGKEIIVNGSQAGEEYVKELMGGEEYAALEQRVQQILHAEKFSLTDYIRAVLSGETAFSFSDFVRTVSRGMVGQVEGLRRDFVQLIALVLLTSVFNGFAKAFRDGLSFDERRGGGYTKHPAWVYEGANPCFLRYYRICNREYYLAVRGSSAVYAACGSGLFSGFHSASGYPHLYDYGSGKPPG